ncbi:unnamed protein product, partial [Adineta steineri]
TGPTAPCHGSGLGYCFHPRFVVSNPSGVVPGFECCDGLICGGVSGVGLLNIPFPPFPYASSVRVKPDYYNAFPQRYLTSCRKN